MFYAKMVDKLEVRIPRGTKYTPAFADLYGEIAHSEKWRNTFRPSQHYLHTADLREFGHDVMLHSFNRHKEGDHKLELLNTGEKTYPQMLQEIESIFIGRDPQSYDVMRIDAAADVPGVSVSWFQKSARALYKQFAAQWAKQEIEVSTMGKRGPQTIYFGKKPNCIRIYNKTAEQEHQYKKLLRKTYKSKNVENIEAHSGMPVKYPMPASVEAVVPSFFDLFGCEKDDIKTRVERQMAAGRVPHKYTIVGALKRNFLEFNPFDRLEFSKASRLTPEPKPSDFAHFKDYCCAMFVRERSEEMGYDQFRKMATFYTGRNWASFEEKFGRYLAAPEPCEAGITEQELFDRYQTSLYRQMAA